MIRLPHINRSVRRTMKTPKKDAIEKGENTLVRVIELKTISLTPRPKRQTRCYTAGVFWWIRAKLQDNAHYHKNVLQYFIL